EGRPSTAMRRHVPPILAALAVAVMAVALARPALRTPLPRERATIILVMDVSGSMAASDMFPSRLDAAKRASKSFVDALPPAFRIGVVAFSSGATLVQGVTEDYGKVHAAIDSLDIGGGTAIGDGIQVALASIPPDLPPSGLSPPAASPAAPPGQGMPAPPPAIILLLTDGENTEGLPPLDAAQQALAANIPVFTVGMGGRGGLFSRGRGIDEELLKEVAALTGGQYYYAPNQGALNRVYSDLGVALGWDWERHEIGGYVASASLVLGVLGLGLAYLWLHREL
ncbi:MAG TPA: VWA domain-containing protein, partial [Chloroflexota bacterium]|nr:VWA domain-containing protein [Chloroflexota bacterium]